MTNVDTRLSRLHLAALGGLLVAALYLYGYGLGAYRLLDPDEGRYAEIPREMLERGDFITPTLNYLKYFEKPPLFYWLEAASLATFGEKEWAVRLVPALAGALTVALVFLAGRAAAGAWAGLAAAWVYATALLPLVHARLPIIDGWFSALLTATWVLWWRGYTSAGRARAGAYTGAWACLALAVMAKGPAALVLTGLLVFGFLAWNRDLRALRNMAWWPGLLVFAAIALPWHVLVALRNPEWAQFYLIDQNFGRFVGNEHNKGWWFLPVFTLAGMAPWFPLIIPVLWRAAGIARGTGPSADVSRQAFARYLLVWIVAVVGFFSASSCKLVPYILPAMPALALLVGQYFASGSAKTRAARVSMAAAALLLAVVALAGPHLGADQDTLPPEVYRQMVSGVAAQFGVWAALLALSAIHTPLMPLIPGVGALLILPVLLSGVTAVGSHRRTGHLLSALPRPLPPEVRVATWHTYDQSVSFYTHRRVYLVDDTDELAFGKSVEPNADRYFLKGTKGLRELDRSGPVLLNIRREDWPEAAALGLFRPVMANSQNLFVGNAALFRAAGLEPLPAGAIQPGPLMLLPRDANRATQPPEATP